MDFFQYLSFTSSYFSLSSVWVELLVGGLCFAIVYIFQAVGLFTIACREGYRHKWMAFVPFFNTYYIAHVSQKNRCFRWCNTRILGIVLAVFEVVLFSMFVLSYVATYIIAPYADAVTINFGGMEIIDHYELSGLPEKFAWAAWVFNYMSGNLISILSYFDLVFMILKLFLFVCFFQTYAARRYFLFSITAVLFPIAGILIFVVRNNRGLNYQEFLRAEQERRYRIYQQYNQQYNQQYDRNAGQNPYNQNPYNQNPYSRNTPPQGDPFDGVGETPREQNAQSDRPADDNNGGANSSQDPFEGFDKH